MIAAVIILAAVCGILIGAIAGALGVFIVAGWLHAPPKPPLPRDFQKRLEMDLAEIPDNWQPKKREEAGEVDDLSKFTLDPDEVE